MNRHQIRSMARAARRFAGAGKLSVLLLVAVALGGCVRRYDVILTNGQKLENIRKPIRNNAGGYYYYMNAHGQTNYIPSTRVVEIAPHQKSSFNPADSK